ncbi:alpha/beta fold hydrolase [uncultured Ruminococcus sp.]|uniref:alpha/beta fold hydrolase n=1 Tax=uncultured Ruminococcus sp. TaxID=165186 RepID=UPI00262DF0E9|nr:alpha/beta hydrolase [uncultured Ruminococcus sp.]
MSFYIFDNKKIFYEEMGEGTPLIFLHGNTASSKMYEDYSNRYSERFKVILIDFLGHGRSERLSKFPADLWFYEAQQVIAFLRHKKYDKVNIIGSSGGAIVALNVALEVPECVNKVIADSFEGEKADEAFVKNLLSDRSSSMEDVNARGFYSYMHGNDWEQIVRNDTSAIIRHSKEVVDFFHRPLSDLKTKVLLTGSKGDKFMYSVAPDYYEKIYGNMLEKLTNGSMHLFETGDHPAMMTNQEEFYKLSMEFLA